MKPERHPIDPVGGEFGKLEGMERVDRASNPEWHAFMKAVGVEVARRKPFFFADDLARLHADRDGPETHDNRALGPLMMELRREGVCEPTDDFVTSMQRNNHGCPRRVWRSLIYRGPIRHRLRKRKIIDPRQFDMLDLYRE